MAACLHPHSVLKVELGSLGPAKTLPYLVMFAMSNAGGWAGDWLILRKRYSVAGGAQGGQHAGCVFLVFCLLIA